MTTDGARVVAVSASGQHGFSKLPCPAITLVTGRGVAGDAHAGITVQHRSRVAQNPDQPNLRQVHLIHEELFSELSRGGFAVRPGDLGENITTAGIDILALPTGTRLRIGPDATIELTGLRNPCKQIDRFQKGLMTAVLGRDEFGALVRKAGVMAVVLAGGTVRRNDTIAMSLPAGRHEPLRPV